ncbi:hypothetical protein T36_0393 [Helicobacter cinaedi]|uniref:hypothetical protein n=1 Tax=Helicobacter cinaedi TaxID=213 RepID=UPI001F4345A1|nr:hypothetical protein [Helicobacter cinaedi]BDB63946.1 hypothetical protein T36_0393 [Helicobacter cinaedi]
MRVNEVAEIAQGKLLNSPSIAEFSRIICHIEQIQRGDVFIANDSTQIPKAIESGAYGIIYDNPKMEITDSEIAWILVENIADSLIRLIRYKLLAKNVMTISLSPIEEAIAKEIIDDASVKFSSHSLEDIIELLNDEVSFIITHNQNVLDISFEVISSSVPSQRPFLLLSHTLFDSTIFYKSTHYRINLPKIFFNELSSVLSLCENRQISHDMSRFKHIPYFKPNFLNAFGKVIEYGQAAKVAIAEEDIEQFKKYMAYIANNAAWGKFLFLVPLVYLELFNQIAQTFAYSTQEELCEYIRTQNFNFALVLGINDDTLTDALNTNHKQIQEPDLFSSLWEQEAHTEKEDSL